jgi:MoaA/NifB/PqqE/SkfB family radical SAM enzyme
MAGRRRLHAYLHRAANAALASVDLLAPRARLWARPLCFHLEINNYCNLRCVHCMRRNPDNERDTSSWTPEMLERLAPWLSSSAFVGMAGLGEPFIEKNFLDLVERVVQAGPTPSITTNGTLIDEAAAERLAGMGPMLLNVSIDGATAQTYESIRVGGKLERVIENITALQRAKDRKKTPFPLVQIYWCMMKQNLGEMRELADLAQRIDAKIIQLQPFFGIGRPEIDQAMAVSESEMDQAVGRLREAAASAGTIVNYVPVSMSLALEEPSNEAAAKPCFCANLWRFMHCEPNGNVRVCCLGEFELVGNVLEQSLEELWRSPLMLETRRALLRGAPPQTCRSCYLLKPYGRRAATTHLRDFYESIHPRKLFK